MSYPTSLTETQAAMYARLTGDGTLMARVTGIYENVPEGTAMPYVVLGLATEVPANAFGGTDGREVTHTLHVWTTNADSDTGKLIVGDLNRLLDHQTLTLTGAAANVLCEYEYGESLPDPDGLSRQHIVRYRLVSTE